MHAHCFSGGYVENANIFNKNMTSNRKYNANRIFSRQIAASLFFFYLLTLIWMEDLFYFIFNNFYNFLIFKNKILAYK